MSNKVRARDTSSVLSDLKEVNKKETKEDAVNTLHEFLEKWGNKYPKLKESLENKRNLLTYIDFPLSIRQSIYTNNISESFNKQLKRKAKVKEQFPHEVSLEKYVYTYVSKFNGQFNSRIHKGFGIAQFELTQMLDEISYIRNREIFSSPIKDEVNVSVA